MSIKQILIVRDDLKMPKGKLLAQACHSSISFLCDILRSGGSLSDLEKEWIDDGFAKIVLKVNSEQELLDIHQKAIGLGLKSYLITDNGKTFFREPTTTFLAIGPDQSEKIDEITSKLKLY